MLHCDITPNPQPWGRFDTIVACNNDTSIRTWQLGNCIVIMGDATCT